VSKDAILNTTEALKTRLEQAIGPDQVYVGPPIKDDVKGLKASLFLFNVVPNRDLRNIERVAPRPSGSAPSALSVRVEALPVDLRFLISVFRSGTDPSELSTLGEIMLRLHLDPTLSGGILEGQVVRVSLEPYAVDELHRIWGMFPEESYRTSVVYLASPVFIEEPLALGPPVLSRELKQGVSADPTRASMLQEGLAA
jgi:hypothetical protein